MAVTDQTILSEIQRLTLEGTGDGGATWPSGMWTQAEVLDYLNGRQDRFIAETRLFWNVNEDAVTAGQSDQAIPASLRWAGTIFIAYKTAAGQYRELPQMDALELDLIRPTRPGEGNAATPKGYYEPDGSTLTTYIVPPPTANITHLERYFVQLGAALTAGGVNFAVSDEFVPTIKYGTLADMFSKIGPAQNLLLAAACEERWAEGLEIGKLIATEGWFAL